MLCLHDTHINNDRTQKDTEERRYQITRQASVLRESRAGLLEQRLGVLFFSPMAWIAEQDIFHFQFSCFGCPGKSHRFALRRKLLGEPVFLLPCAALCLQNAGLRRDLGFQCSSKPREIIWCYTAGCQSIPVLVAARERDCHPVFSQRLFQAASGLTGESRERGLRNRKKRSPFLESENIFPKYLRKLRQWFLFQTYISHRQPCPLVSRHSFLSLAQQGEENWRLADPAEQ